MSASPVSYTHLEILLQEDALALLRQVWLHRTLDDFSFSIRVPGFILLACDIVVIAVKNRCPFCHKQLRIAPIRGGEYCPHCGCEIK